MSLVGFDHCSSGHSPQRSTRFCSASQFFSFFGGWIRNLLSRIVILMTGQPTTPNVPLSEIAGVPYDQGL